MALPTLLSRFLGLSSFQLTGQVEGRSTVADQLPGRDFRKRNSNIGHHSPNLRVTFLLSGALNCLNLPHPRENVLLDLNS